MRMQETSPITIADLWYEVEPRIASAEYLEQAAQELAKAIHTHFAESVVLARVFLTLAFEDLPAANQEFVRSLSESAGAGSQLQGTTPVLSLLGTHGAEADWRDRRKSKGHVGIPLASSSFVDAVPMISRLLKELGLPLDWVDTQDSDVIQKTIGKSAGLFFVEDAGQATDNQGRKIIAAQDFVASRDIKSVFGIGSAYPGDALLVIVAFSVGCVPSPLHLAYLDLSKYFQPGRRPILQ